MDMVDWAVTTLALDPIPECLRPETERDGRAVHGKFQLASSGRFGESEVRMRSGNTEAGMECGRGIQMHKTILIVDDHEIVRHFIRTVICTSRPDWEVCGEATNGKEAIEAVKALKPDVVILDLMMPVMGGLEAASQIGTLAPKPRVLVFTLYESKELMEEARKAGADGYISKSRAGTDLLRAIDGLETNETFFSSTSLI
jgi:CheY-like chemotaxis protein